MNGLLVAAGAVVVPVAAAELLHWQASHGLLTAGPAPAAASEAVVVLGYPTPRSGRLHPLQRWRVEIGVRSMRPGRDSRLVFTGAGKPGRPSEAEVMSAYAQERFGVPADQIVLEREARNTQQNVELSMRLVDGVQVVTFASDPLHAARARRYALELLPAGSVRLETGQGYRVLDRPLLKVATAAYELFLAARDARRRMQDR
jgi:uncharacterized SAM-binding protein YcdF (DUF218 family)